MMTILFIGEDLNKSRSGVVTVMNQILADKKLQEDFKFKTIFTTSDDYSTLKKLLGWCKAYLKFLISLPSCKIIHIHHASDLNFWLSSGMVTCARLFGKKSILHNHSADFHEFYNKSSDKAKKRIVKVFTMTNGNIVLSKHWLQWYSSIAPDANWFMLQNTIEVPENIPPKILIADKVNLLYLARLEQRKGFFDLIDIMPSIINDYPHIKLFVAGQGDIGKAKALTIEKNIGNNVEILGHIDKIELDKLLRKCHILVFPSYNEGLPMALLEAMSYGVVALTTPVGGIPDVVISEKNGILIDPGDTKALAGSLSVLLNDAAKYAELSKNAFAVIYENFNYKNYGLRLKAIYNQVLDNKKN